MVHTLPEEQRDLLGVIERFVREQVAPHADEHEANATFPIQTYRELAALGGTGIAFPEDVGGSGLAYRTYLLALEELARGHATLALAVSVNTLTAGAIDRFGSAELRQAAARPLVEGGQLGAYSLSEPQAGSDAASLVCRAERDGEVYRVTGTKAWVTHGGIADRYVLFARTSDDGSRGISAFVVEADTPGVHVAKAEDKMGLRGSPTTMLAFDGAIVPADQRLGDEGAGFRIAMAALDGGRLGIAAVATGVAQSALDHALRYAREREQFDRPIIDFQGVSFLLADMATGIEAGRALYKDAASRWDAGFDAGKVAAMSKLLCTDTAMRVTTDAVQVLGGVGYTRDFPVERLMREAKVMQIFEGTNQIQRVVIARRLAQGS
ncbi:MAG TPA: acyl-CoA dehydrogenase family protein [Nitriliruptorales bacterium]